MLTKQPQMKQMPVCKRSSRRMCNVLKQQPCPLCFYLVLKLYPALGEVLARVATTLLASGASGGICTARPGLNYARGQGLGTAGEQCCYSTYTALQHSDSHHTFWRQIYSPQLAVL